MIQVGNSKSLILLDSIDPFLESAVILFRYLLLLGIGVLFVHYLLQFNLVAFL